MRKEWKASRSFPAYSLLVFLFVDFYIWATRYTTLITYCNNSTNQPPSWIHVLLYFKMFFITNQHALTRCRCRHLIILNMRCAISHERTSPLCMQRALISAPTKHPQAGGPRSGTWRVLSTEMTERAWRGTKPNSQWWTIRSHKSSMLSRATAKWKHWSQCKLLIRLSRW